MNNRRRRLRRRSFPEAAPPPPLVPSAAHDTGPPLPPQGRCRVAAATEAPPGAPRALTPEPLRPLRPEDTGRRGLPPQRAAPKTRSQSGQQLDSTDQASFLRVDPPRQVIGTGIPVGVLERHLTLAHPAQAVQRLHHRRPTATQPLVARGQRRGRRRQCCAGRGSTPPAAAGRPPPDWSTPRPVPGRGTTAHRPAVRGSVPPSIAVAPPRPHPRRTARRAAAGPAAEAPAPARPAPAPAGGLHPRFD